AKNPPASIALRLPLERAKTLAALAEQSDDHKQRDERLTQARIAFEQHLQTQTDSRIAADLRLELARMIMRQGRFRVIAARRLDNKSERQDGFARARLLFDSVGRELRTVRAALDRELAGAPESERAAIINRISETKFETAALAMNRALTYSDRNAEQFARRGQELHDARRQFMALAELDAHDPLSWRAFVEAGRCWMELDSSADAFNVFSAIV